MIKQLYRVLAFLIAAGVVLQAAAIAYAVFGMFEWVSAGGTIDKALIESDSPQIGGIAGFNLHQLVGVNILPLLALLFLISLVLRPNFRRYQMGSDRLRRHAGAKPPRHLRARKLGSGLASWVHGADLVHLRARLRGPG